MRFYFSNLFSWPSWNYSPAHSLKVSSHIPESLETDTTDITAEYDELRDLSHLSLSFHRYDESAQSTLGGPIPSINSSAKNRIIHPANLANGFRYSYNLYSGFTAAKDVQPKTSTNQEFIPALMGNKTRSNSYLIAGTAEAEAGTDESIFLEEGSRVQGNKAIFALGNDAMNVVNYSSDSAADCAMNLKPRSNGYQVPRSRLDEKPIIESGEEAQGDKHSSPGLGMRSRSHDLLDQGKRESDHVDAYFLSAAQMHETEQKTEVNDQRIPPQYRTIEYFTSSLSSKAKGCLGMVSRRSMQTVTKVSSSDLALTGKIFSTVTEDRYGRNPTLLELVTHLLVKAGSLTHGVEQNMVATLETVPQKLDFSDIHSISVEPESEHTADKICYGLGRTAIYTQDDRLPGSQSGMGIADDLDPQRDHGLQLPVPSSTPNIGQTEDPDYSPTALRELQTSFCRLRSHSQSPVTSDSALGLSITSSNCRPILPKLYLDSPQLSTEIGLGINIPGDSLPTLIAPIPRAPYSSEQYFTQRERELIKTNPFERFGNGLGFFLVNDEGYVDGTVSEDQCQVSELALRELEKTGGEREEGNDSGIEGEIGSEPESPVESKGYEVDEEMVQQLLSPENLGLRSFAANSDSTELSHAGLGQCYSSSVFGNPAIKQIDEQSLTPEITRFGYLVDPIDSDLERDAHASASYFEGSEKGHTMHEPCQTSETHTDSREIEPSELAVPETAPLRLHYPAFANRPASTELSLAEFGQRHSSSVFGNSVIKQIPEQSLTPEITRFGDLVDPIDSDLERDAHASASYFEGSEKVHTLHESCQTSGTHTDSREIEPSELADPETAPVRIHHPAFANRPAFIEQEMPSYTAAFIEKDLTDFINRQCLHRFYAEGHASIAMIAQKAAQLIAEGEDPEYICALTKIAQYEIVVLCDDSGSMKLDDRIPALKDALNRILQVATHLGDSGISVRWLNTSTKKSLMDGLQTPECLAKMLDKIEFQGGTLLGAQLQKKVLNPFLVRKMKKKLEKPVLVTIITDGEPDDPNELFTNLRQIRFDLRLKKYEESAVAFQISQVGDSLSASLFLDKLAQHEDVAKDIYCTVETLDQQSSRFKTQEEYNRWWAKELLTAIDPFKVS